MVEGDDATGDTPTRRLQDSANFVSVSYLSIFGCFFETLLGTPSDFMEHFLDLIDTAKKRSLREIMACLGWATDICPIIRELH